MSSSVAAVYDGRKWLQRALLDDDATENDLGPAGFEPATS
jgi:hypothetical protein